MEIYESNLSKKKKVLKRFIKKQIKSINGFVKVCYYMTLFLRILAIVFGIITVLYVVLYSDYLVEILFLLVTFGVPMALSYLPATVYIISIGGEYRLRRCESVSFETDYFVYSYRDGKTGIDDQIFAFKVPYRKISDIKYDSETRLLEISGDIIVETYENSILKESISVLAMDLLDAYDIDVNEKIRKMMKG